MLYCTRKILLFAAPLCLAASANAQLAGLPGIQSVTFYEQTGSLSANTFTLGSSTSAALTTQITGGPTSSNRDFRGLSAESYDVFLSDCDGILDPNGNYLTVVCFDNRSAQDGAVGNNIDAVQLDFSSGISLYAASICSVQTGGGLIDPAYISSNGFASRILGPSDSLSTRLGTGASRITVGFVPEPGMSALMTGAFGLGGALLLRRRKCAR